MFLLAPQIENRSMGLDFFSIFVEISYGRLSRVISCL